MMVRFLSVVCGNTKRIFPSGLFGLRLLVGDPAILVRRNIEELLLAKCIFNYGRLISTVCKVATATFAN